MAGIILKELKARAPFTLFGAITAIIIMMFSSRLPYRVSCNWFSSVTIFIFLFLAVWLPCCVSDIVFPLLFVTNEQKEGR